MAVPHICLAEEVAAAVSIQDKATASEQEFKLSFLLRAMAFHMPFRIGEPQITTDRPDIDLLPMPDSNGREVWLRTSNSASWAAVQVMPLLKLGEASGFKTPLLYSGQVANPFQTSRNGSTDPESHLTHNLGIVLFPLELSLSSALDKLVATGKIKSVRRTKKMEQVQMVRLGAGMTAEDQQDPKAGLDYWIVAAFHVNKTNGKPVTLTICTTKWGDSAVRIGWITEMSFAHMKHFLYAAGDAVRDLRGTGEQPPAP